ncbi:MAG: hypothetical protein ACRD1H_06995, partial [Vicinamibacterales bacterium]
MFELALRTALILGLAWMIARLLAGAAAATRHLIWHLAVIAVLAAPLIAPIAPEFRVPGVPGVSQDLRRDGSQTVPVETATPKELHTHATPSTP